MTERRYSEDEVKAIFAHAARPDATHRLGGTSGLTLAELQDIGREAGLSAESVSRAAAVIDARPAQVTRRFFGLPITVGRAIDLGREMSDTEWERLVVDLRTTFNARGRLETQGGLRHWWNGNLHVMVEPGSAGQRVRMQTTRRISRDWMVTGLLGMGTAAVLAIMHATSIATDASFFQAASILGLGGAALFAIGALRLPSWAARRREQMEAVITRLLAKPAP
jgi:hypothetical protein